MMKFGIGIPTSREGMRHPSPFISGPEDIVKTVKLAEDLDLDSAWGSEHNNLVPVMRIPLEEPLPKWYEILISLAYCSAVTTKIYLGTSVLLMPFREPFMLAKQLATIDQFSKGRLLFGVGLGGFREEVVSILGQDKSFHRGNMLDEQLELLHLLFNKETVNYKGDYYQIHDVKLSPKPYQNPLPTYVSGESPNLAYRVAKWASGQSMSMESDIPKKITSLKIELHKRDRNIAEIDLLAHGHLSLANTKEEAISKYLNSRLAAKLKPEKSHHVVESYLIGTTEQVAEKIVNYARMGITHTVATNITANTLSELMEQIEMFAKEVVPLVKKAIS